MHVIPEGDTTELDSQAKRTAIARLHELLASDAREWCTPQFEIETGDVAVAILDSAQTKKAALIVLGARHKSPLADHIPWGTVSTVVRGAHCPVLVVPARDA
jgi:nucleotide-binding universal stress UspA family protein